MNMKKKILALIMLAMLAACMAIPAFATEYCFTPVNQNNVYLNLVGSPGSNMYMRRLSLYRTSVLGEDQRFTRRTINVGGQEATYWMKDNQYAINKSNGSYLEGYVAFMWPVNYAAQEINNDSLFCAPNTSNPLRLLRHDLGLAYTSSNTGATVYFSETGSSWSYRSL